MNQGNQNVSHLQSVPTPPVSATSGGGNGNGHGPRWSELDARLREVEKSVGEIKVEISHLATRKDIESMKVDFIKWAVGTVVAVIASSIWVINAFFLD